MCSPGSFNPFNPFSFDFHKDFFDQSFLERQFAQEMRKMQSLIAVMMLEMMLMMMEMDIGGDDDDDDDDDDYVKHDTIYVILQPLLDKNGDHHD